MGEHADQDRPSTTEREADLIDAVRRQVDDAANIGHDTVTSPAGTISPEGAPDPSRLPADSFTGYQIVREVHRGGQGVVYQAVHKSTKRKVAIKVMREGPFAGPSDKARFEREVQVLGQLKHPHIVGIHDTGVAAGCHYFVMDYISGQPLDVFIASRQPSLEETLKLFATICEAVSAAHLKGVIHRDLKPGNIRIDTEGQPHILDFGLAKVAVPLASSPYQGGAGGVLIDEGGDGGVFPMTITGQFIGSLPWASPEQAEGNPSKIDIRTDVYSLGVILYQMLTGRFPYDVVGNMRDVLDRILKAEPAKPSTIRRQINDEVETIVLKCLSKERERRYQSAGELARDITRYLAGEPIEAKRDSGLYVLRMYLRRFKTAVVITAGFVLLLVSSSVALSILYGRAETQAVAARRERDRALAAELQQSRERERAESALAAEAQQRTRAEKIADFMSRTLAGAGPSVALGRDATMLREMMDAAAKRIREGELTLAPEAEVRLRLTIGSTYRELAAYDAAEEMLRPAVELGRASYGEQHAEVATSLNELGLLLIDRGQAAEALGLLQAALDIRQRLFAGDHRDVAESINDVGTCLAALGREAEALSKYEAALEMDQRLFTGDHPDVATALNNVATSLHSHGRPAESAAEV